MVYLQRQVGAFFLGHSVFAHQTIFGQQALLPHVQYDGFAAGHFHRLSGPVRQTARATGDM
jgi:hypothetical protein